MARCGAATVDGTAGDAASVTEPPPSVVVSSDSRYGYCARP